MAIKSSGVAPVLLTTSMMACRFVPLGHLNILGAACSTCTRDCGVTTVSPLPKGAGWLTWELSPITTLRPAWETAAGRTVTPSEITTVPVRELKMTLGVSGPTSIASASSLATNATR